MDALPDDLNMAEHVGPYTFPNNNRRRIPAAMYIVIGLVAVVAYLVFKDTSALVNVGFAVAGAGLILFGFYGMVAGWTLNIDETDALIAASTRVGFAVGHASAQQVWRGWLSRPIWRILVYSTENPPRRRGMVLVDGVSGDVIEWFAEDNPEDWESIKGVQTGLSAT